MEYQIYEIRTASFKPITTQKVVDTADWRRN